MRFGITFPLLGLRCLYLLIIIGVALPCLADVANPSSAVANINLVDEIHNEIKQLESLRNKLEGQEDQALQLEIFQKNIELRNEIAAAFQNQHFNKPQLIDEVKQQNVYTDVAVVYLTKLSEKLSFELNKANNDKKLQLLTQLEDVRSYLDTVYSQQAQNITWYKLLNISDSKIQTNFKLEIKHKSESIAANSRYLIKQQQNYQSQIDLTPDGEKAGIQLRLFIIDRQINIETRSLKSIIPLCDQFGLQTAEYKQLYFESTGKITKEFFNINVLTSIFNTWYGNILTWLSKNILQIILHFILFIFVIILAKSFASLSSALVKRAVSNKKLDFSLLMQDFFVSITNKIIWIIGILIALSQIGVDLTPVLTGFGIAGIIVGIALQDSLSNFASGMMLLIYRPFDVGDYVLAGGVEGKVSHMTLVNATIKTFDNQIIIVPNNRIWGDVIKNMTQERVRRVDMIFGVSYSDKIEFVESVLLDLVTNHPAVLRSPEPMIKVSALSDSSVDFIVRPWVKTDDYWDVYWDITREVKIRFDKEGISIPFPQSDIHLYSERKS